MLPIMGDRIRSSYTNKFEHGLHREKGHHDNGGHDLTRDDLGDASPPALILSLAISNSASAPHLYAGSCTFL
jgi:hypothetical protein